MLYACHLICCMWFYFGTSGMNGPVGLGLGRIVALYSRSSASYHIR